MAIAVTQGHVQRAIDFYKKAGKYFAIGGTQAWESEDGLDTPPNPSTDDYRLTDIIGLKLVETCDLVVPDENYGTIQYRTQKWRVVKPPFSTTILRVDDNGLALTVSSIENIAIGIKVRVDSTYEGKVVDIDHTANKITLDKSAPTAISTGAILEGGALVEGAKYVYVDCALRHDQFPLETYRQIGLVTEVPSTEDILRSAPYTGDLVNQYPSLGVLEVLDNRAPTTRNIDQVEELSLILEF